MLDNESPRSTTFDRVSPSLLKHSHWKFALLRVTSRITYTSRIKYHLLLADFSFAPQRNSHDQYISLNNFETIIFVGWQILDTIVKLFFLSLVRDYTRCKDSETKRNDSERGEKSRHDFYLTGMPLISNR